MFKQLNLNLIPIQVFLFIFWFKNGFIDKLVGVCHGLISPDTAYHGDTWDGWKEYIVGTWDKSAVGHTVLSPTFDFMFPILIILQILPAIMILISVFNLESFKGNGYKWINNAATASLFVTSGMLFTQTLSGASDGQYLWQLLGFGMILKMYIRVCNK